MFQPIERGLKNHIGEVYVKGPNKEIKKVPVLVGTPQAWLQKKEYPSINISLLDEGTRFDRFRFRPLPAIVYDDIKDVFFEIPYKMPFKYLYVIEFITKYRTDFNYIASILHKRFKPFGFGSYVTISGDDCPYRIVDQIDLTRTDTEINYRYSITLEIDGWLQLEGELQEDGTIGDGQIPIREIPKIKQIITEYHLK